jgi:hypothetical protein
MFASFGSPAAAAISSLLATVAFFLLRGLSGR